MNKVKVFNVRFLDLETEISQFFQSNPNINVISTQLAYSNTYEFCVYVIVYKES